MPSVRKSALLPYASLSMFKLVSDIESYPQFLPWCADARVLRREGHEIDAQILVDYRGLKLSFSSRNTERPPQAIALSLLGGPFRELTGGWQFTKLDEQACKVEFGLDYALNLGLLSGALSPVFDHIANTMIDAFVRRAEQIHGPA
jgi:ribosome-associated toxin RatA of RatAB toxin-antitoxin module